MDKFTTWTAVAVPFDQPNIDTNALCPTRFNKVEKGPKYAQVLFHDLRFNPDGSEKPDFILNQPPYRKAGIIVAERNFGCGSSRESAVYAVATFGIRAIIAPSFGDIFFNNSFKNGFLPIVLPPERCAELRAALERTPGARLIVDLEAQTVTGPVGVNDGGGSDHFDIDPFRKQLLLSGMDDISFTLNHKDNIAAFEARFAKELPWI
jgi:3-isopropylmalate/(R)-2-methylmalate dehydratase small subunit